MHGCVPPPVGGGNLNYAWTNGQNGRVDRRTKGQLFSKSLFIFDQNTKF